MSETETAAHNLMDFLRANAGETADWPIDLIARDKDSGDELARLLNALSSALPPNPKPRTPTPCQA